jgi:glycogen synthase
MSCILISQLVISEELLHLCAVISTFRELTPVLLIVELSFKFQWLAAVTVHSSSLSDGTCLYGYRTAIQLLCAVIQHTQCTSAASAQTLRELYQLGVDGITTPWQVHQQQLDIHIWRARCTAMRATSSLAVTVYNN